MAKQDKQFKAFRTSSSLAALAQSCRDKSKSVNDLPHLDLSSVRFGTLSEFSEIDIVCEAIGERLTRLLGTVARHAYMIHPELEKTLVMPSEAAFIQEVERDLAVTLGLSLESSNGQRFRKLLANEFFRWAESHPFEKKAMGLEIDETRRVFLKVIKP